jgi:hypothetical protein
MYMGGAHQTWCMGGLSRQAPHPVRRTQPQALGMLGTLRETKVKPDGGQ